MAKLGIVSFCRASHGKDKHEHDLRIEITFEGSIINNFVDGIDFHDVKRVIGEELGKLEGKYLDDFLNAKASVENIGIYLLKSLKDRGISNLYSIRINEEPDRFVEIYFDEIEK